MIGDRSLNQLKKKEKKERAKMLLKISTKQNKHCFCSQSNLMLYWHGEVMALNENNVYGFYKLTTKKNKKGQRSSFMWHKDFLQVHKEPFHRRKSLVRVCRGAQSQNSDLLTYCLVANQCLFCDSSAAFSTWDAYPLQYFLSCASSVISARSSLGCSLIGCWVSASSLLETIGQVIFVTESVQQ